MIKIGADELILWLRKNNYAKNITNDELGKKIHTIIANIGGRLIEHDQITFWDNDKNAKNINELLLPKTAAQYEVDLSQLPQIYQSLTYIDNE